MRSGPAFDGSVPLVVGNSLQDLLGYDQGIKALFTRDSRHSSRTNAFYEILLLFGNWVGRASLGRLFHEQVFEQMFFQTNLFVRGQSCCGKAVC